jgi:predicted site-specific integrase-resolvase
VRTLLHGLRAPRTLDELEGHAAWLYVRESTRAQGKKYGPAAQRERAERFAEAYGLTVERIFEDLRSGRSLAKRDAFNAMLAALPGSGAQVVMVAYASRWARDEFDGFSTLKALHEATGCLVVADKALLSTDEGRFTELAREIVEAAHYSRELSRNIRDGIAEKLRIRGDVWSHPLLGFHRTGEHRTIQPDPKMMPTAIRAFEMASNGMPDQAIADNLGVTLWRIRGALRSPLYVGRLPDGRPTTFSPPVPLHTWERAQAERHRRSKSGHHPRHRLYPLSDRGPLVCDRCGRPLKGRARYRRGGAIRYYRHDDNCEAWQSAEVRAEQLEEQVGRLLDGAKPNRESAARIRAALQTPPPAIDRTHLARIDRELRELALQLVDPEGADRETILGEIDRLQAERLAVDGQVADSAIVPADDALDYLNDLGRLWRRTTDEGRRALASSVFARLGAIAGSSRQLHDPRHLADGRIVSVEVTDYAERRGLVLALPVRLEVIVVGDTGLEPVTSCMSSKCSNQLS